MQTTIDNLIVISSSRSKTRNHNNKVSTLLPHVLLFLPVSPSYPLRTGTWIRAVRPSSGGGCLRRSSKLRAFAGVPDSAVPVGVLRGRCCPDQVGGTDLLPSRRV